MNHAMIDLETFGTRPGSIVLSIGVCYFNASGILLTKEVVLPYFDQVELGLTSDPDTRAWGRKQGAAAQHVIHQSINQTKTIAECFNEVFVDWSSFTPATVWAYSPSFDCVLLTEVARRAGIVSRPWADYRAERDARTVLKLFGEGMSDYPECRVGVQHSAGSDAESQARMLIAWAGRHGMMERVLA